MPSTATTQDGVSSTATTQDGWPSTANTIFRMHSSSCLCKIVLVFVDIVSQIPDHKPALVKTLENEVFVVPIVVD
jgi:hypothetical protein